MPLFSSKPKITNMKEVQSIFFKKRIAVVGDLVKVCPGKRHAWYNSNVGLIRKPINS